MNRDANYISPGLTVDSRLFKRKEKDKCLAHMGSVMLNWT